MKKILVILCIVVNIIILTLCIEKIFYNIITFSFKNGCEIWCDSDEMEYIKGEYGITEDFNIVVYEVSWSGEETTNYIIKELPYGFGQKIEITLDWNLSEYVIENDNAGEVIIKSVIPYTIIGVVNIILIAIMIKNITK